MYRVTYNRYGRTLAPKTFEDYAEAKRFLYAVMRTAWCTGAELRRL